MEIIRATCGGFHRYNFKLLQPLSVHHPPFRRSAPATDLILSTKPKLRHQKSTACALLEDRDSDSAAKSANADVSLLVKKRASEVSHDLKGTSLFLVGINSSIKSNLGKHLADALRYYYIDSDSVVEDSVGGKAAAASIIKTDKEGFQDSEKPEVDQQFGINGQSPSKNRKPNGIAVWAFIGLALAQFLLMHTLGSCGQITRDLISSLTNLLDETMHLVFVTLQAVVRAGSEILPSGKSLLSPSILNVWASLVTDPFASIDVLTVLEAMKTVPGCIQPLVSRILPYVRQVLTKPQPQLEGLVAGSLDLLTLLLKPLPMDDINAVGEVSFDPNTRIILQSEMQELLGWSEIPRVKEVKMKGQVMKIMAKQSGRYWEGRVAMMKLISGLFPITHLEDKTEVLRQLSSMGRLLVSAGSGAVRCSTNLALLRHGISIWIDVPLKLVAREVVEDKVQLSAFELSITGESYSEVLAQMAALLEERRSGYATADATVSLTKVASRLGYEDLCSVSTEELCLEVLKEITKLLRLKKMIEEAARPF